MESGLKAVDSLVPVGRGQRELDQYHDGPDFHVLHEGDVMAFFLQNPDGHHGGGTADRRKIAT